ncbi:MAG: glycosyltransferase family 39 protein [Oscillospiraceae bacterium]|nr:glycosyltransferase family 39 protein [Oscillospiraceae bacterium]
MKKAANTGFYIIIILTLLFASFLSVISMFQTVDMNTDNDWLENVEFNYNAPILSWIVILVVAGLFLFLYRFCKNRSTLLYEYREPILDKLPIALAFFVFVMGINWVYSAQVFPTHDSWYMINAAQTLSKGDYSFITLESEAYFHRFPLQLGYVFFNEIIIRFFRVFGEAETTIYLQCINVLMLAVAYMGLVNITKLTFQKNAVTLFTSLLLFICFQPVMFTTLLNGSTPGFMFAVLAIWFLLKFFKEYKLGYGVLSSVFVGLAVWLRHSNIIVLVSFCIIIILNLLKRNIFKKAPRIMFKSITVLLLAVIFGSVITSLTIWQYEKRANIEMSDGVPTTAYLLMGFNEAGIAPGWHNSSPFGAYGDNDRNKSAAAAQNMEAFRERLKELSEDPSYTMDFFFHKFTSQWNEPTYQSIWTNQVRGYNEDKTGIAAYVCDPDEGEQSTKKFLSLYNTFIFTMFSAGLIFMLKKRENKIVFALFPLIILGGFLYHILLEAKSQFSIFYFVMMLPVAGYGLFNVVKLLEKWTIEEDKYYLMVIPKYYLQIPVEKKYEIQIFKKDFLKTVRDDYKASSAPDIDNEKDEQNENS